jgi:hypothetical protein
MPPYPRPLCFLHFPLQSAKQLVSFSMHIHFIAPLQHHHNNFQNCAYLTIKLLSQKGKYHPLQFGSAGYRSSLWTYNTAISKTPLFLAIHYLHSQTIVSFISTYQTFQNVVQHLKRVLSIVPISMATFIPNTFFYCFSSLSHFMTGSWPWGVGI